MRHNIKAFGYNYKLRPVELSDAQFIIDTRLEDEKKSKYIHKIKNDITLQENWLKEYFSRENDYYFVIENLFTGEKEGLISIYNIDGTKAEWGRWVLKNGSLASYEGVMLMYNIGFCKLGLEEIYTNTIKDNKPVVAFHEQLGANFRKIIPEAFEIENQKYDAVEQYVTKSMYDKDIKNKLEEKSKKLFERNLRLNIGNLKFHHYGVAAQNIESSFENYKTEYEKGGRFEDELQGVKGLFINSESKPTLELLENLPNAHTLDYFINNNTEIYHAGYLVENYQKGYDFLINKLGAKIVSDTKESKYFKGKICFLMLKNKKIIELIEIIRDNSEK